MNSRGLTNLQAAGHWRVGPDVARKLEKAYHILQGAINDWDLLYEALKSHEVLGKTDRRAALPGGNRTLAVVGDHIAKVIISTKGWKLGWISAKLNTAHQVMTNQKLAVLCQEAGITDCIIGNPGQWQIQASQKATAMEALIGAAGIYGGLEAAEKVMKILDIPICEE